MNKNNNKNSYSNGKRKARIKREQPRKDSKDKRVNFDNTRESKFEKDVDEMTTPKDGSNNDIDWYSSNPELVKAAGSIPFASVIGSGLHWSGGTQTISGIMSIAWTPSLGMQGMENDIETGDFRNPPFAVNQAGKAMYSYVVHANSRNRSYEYQDMMTLILAGSQVYSALSAVIRAYGIAKTYAEQNLYLPDAVLHSMGFIPENVRTNLANMWFGINELIARTKQIWIPNVLPITKRWFWLNSNVFTDANEVKAQQYIFVQNCYWIYDETITKTGGGLVPVDDRQYNNSPNSTLLTQFSPAQVQYTWEQWYNVINAMIEALVSSEDRGIIFGDLLKAYGPERIYSMAPIPVDYQISPTYNQEVLTQIENLTINRDCAVSGVIQTPRGLFPVWKEAVKIGTLQAGFYNANVADTSLVNFHFPTQPTPADVMIATRLKSHASCLGNGYFLGKNQGQYFISYMSGLGIQVPQNEKVEGIDYESTYYAQIAQSCGTEIVNFVLVYTYTSMNNAPSIIIMDNVGNSDGSLTNLDNAFSKFRELMAFDWHPFIYQIANTPSSQTAAVNYHNYYKPISAYGDFDNYTIIDTQTLNKIHTTAVYSLFGNPQTI